MPKTITLDMLKTAGACARQAKLFKKTFGQEVEVTVPLAKQYSQAFDWNWAAGHFLSPAARAAYLEATAPAWAAYCEARAAAGAAYCEARAAAGAAYREATAPAE